jgi:hypothetical protein
MAVLVCLLVPLSRTVFRKLRLYSRSAVAVVRCLFATRELNEFYFGLNISSSAEQLDPPGS